MWVRVYHHIRVGERVRVQGVVDVIIGMCVNHSRGRVRFWCRGYVFVCVGVGADAWRVVCSAYVVFVIGVGERVRVKGVIVCVCVRVGVGVGGHAAWILAVFMARCCCRCYSCCFCLGWGLS